jgi:translation initiation factor IF-3
LDGGNGIARRRSHNSRVRVPETRINKRIAAKEVRLIDVEGEQLGVVGIEDALRISEEKEVDLVEIASKATPPVCKLMDYGKFKYEQKKQQSAKKQKDQTVKEIKFRPNIGDHDLEVKVNRMRGFLEAGHKTRIRIFQGQGNSSLRPRSQTRPECLRRTVRCLLRGHGAQNRG